MSAAPHLLTVRNLHAGYGKAEVLSGLSLHASAGSVVTVIGPNGAGKSTMLNAIMGVLPARGELLFNGENLARDSLEERVMRGIALVPERRELFSTMPVEDNLVLGAFRRFRLREPGWREVAPGHFVACHFAGQPLPTCGSSPLRDATAI